MAQRISGKFIALKQKKPVSEKEPHLNLTGDIPVATAEDCELAVQAARRALSRNKGRDWALASGVVRSKYLRAIAAKSGLGDGEVNQLEVVVGR